MPIQHIEQPSPLFRTVYCTVIEYVRRFRDLYLSAKTVQDKNQYCTVVLAVAIITCMGSKPPGDCTKLES